MEKLDSITQAPDYVSIFTQQQTTTLTTTPVFLQTVFLQQTNPTYMMPQTPPTRNSQQGDSFLTSTTQATSITTTPVFAEECADKDSAACYFYKQNGYCESSYFLSQFQMSVADYCPDSCNLCKECVDSQPNCVLWASFDLCPKLATLSPNPCRKSCHVCQTYLISILFNKIQLFFVYLFFQRFNLRFFFY